MKVLLINGSPRKNGNTHLSLEAAAEALQEQGIESEILWIGSKPIRGCTACGACSRNGNHRCVFDDDVCNEFIAKAADFDGYIIGSPVYYAGLNGSLKSLLDRMFYAGSALFAYKPSAGIAVARRAGTTLTADEINKFFQINAMPVVSSSYWGVVHGRAEGEAAGDGEGLHTVRGIARNMAWLLKCIEAGKAAGIERPEAEPKPFTNFIREDLLDA